MAQFNLVDEMYYWLRRHSQHNNRHRRHRRRHSDHRRHRNNNYRDTDRRYMQKPQFPCYGPPVYAHAMRAHRF